MKLMRRLTVLTENTVQRRGLLAEHGLAIWLDLGSSRVLFDTGQTNIILHNADFLEIDLASADAIVLSHGHYDHTGGLSAVLMSRKKSKVFAHPEALADKYARNTDDTGRYIGMPAEVRKKLREDSNMVSTEFPTEIGGGLMVTGPIPRFTDFEDTGSLFFKDKSCRESDKLIDDQAAFFETPVGTVVILGCAHAGIINTLRYVKQLIPGRPIHTVIGGTHLVNADDERIEKTIKALREFDIQRLLPLHCTGFAAAARLWREFPGHVAICPVGTSLELNG